MTGKIEVQDDPQQMPYSHIDVIQLTAADQGLRKYEQHVVDTHEFSALRLVEDSFRRRAEDGKVR